MITLEDHVLKHIDKNLSQILSLLCTWSLSIYPLMKSSKFLSNPSYSNDSDIKVITMVTTLLCINLLELIGIDKSRPWAEIKSILKQEYEKGYKAGISRITTTSVITDRDNTIRELEKENRHLKQSLSDIRAQLGESQNWFSSLLRGRS